jgi:Holliday junction resolvasome RuvABC endonuclease subunit
MPDRIMGIDCSSKVSGFAISFDDEVMFCDEFTSDADREVELNMADFYEFSIGMIEKLKPALVVIEELNVNLNLDTIRKIVRFQSMAMLATVHTGIPSTRLPVTSARKVVLGHGNISKEDAASLMRARYRTLRRSTLDECDAAVLALAGPYVVDMSLVKAGA